MARGKRWQSACVACLIGVLLASCHVAPYATGQALTVEAIPSSLSTVSNNASHHVPAETSTAEPADSTADSSTSEGVYSEEDFSSSGGEPSEHPTGSSYPETEEGSLEDAEELPRSLPGMRVSQHSATEDVVHTESSLVEASSHAEPEMLSRRTVSSTTSTSTPTPTGSGGQNCIDRPFIDMTRSGGPNGYQQHKFPQGTRPRVRRLQRTESSTRRIQPQSARSGAGPQGGHPDGDEDSEVVELYAALYGYRIFRSPGDLMLTLIAETDDYGATLFAIDRINELRLVAGDDMTIGLTIIHLLNTSLVQRVLQQEVNYLKECSTNTVGIFVSPHLWPAVRLLSETLDYNIFPLPATHDLLFTKAAHLLYELPWTNPNSSAMVHGGSNELRSKFNAICRHEHLCLESYPSADTFYILLGLEPSISFATNGTLVLVMMSNEEWLSVSDLPDGAFVIVESDINVATLGFSWQRYGTALRGTDVLAIGSMLLEVVDLVRRAGNECRNASIECMNNWKYHARRTSSEVLSELQLTNATQLMTVELRQKTVSAPSATANRTHAVAVDEVDQLKLIASSNVITNYTTVYQRVASDAPSKLGTIFYCAKEFEIRHPDFVERHHHQRPVYYGGGDEEHQYGEMYWQIKMEAWVAAGLTVSSLGILLCAAILIFLIVRVCMDDILEGHPLGSILLLVSLIVQFAAFIPFSMEYTGYTTPDFTGHRTDTMHIWNTHCTVKIFLVSMCYCMTFSLLLCRAIMLASIGSEGGFLSHINGYIQSVICGFSTLVQLGLSSQLVIVLHAHAHSISCGEIYYGHWFWAVIAYDGILLVSLIFLAPFIFRSQRNYREGLLLVTGSVLCLVIWTVWIPLCMFGYEWREAAISLGLVATALAVLVGIMIPRCFLMVRSIARSDLVQALPSLTSLAFAQANQFISDQSVYECVNPAMRQRTPTDDNFVMDQDLDEAYSANSEIPTLPLRGQRRLRQENGTITMSTSNGTLGPGSTLVPPNVANVTHIAPNFYGISNPYSCSDSLSSISPNKITRF
uniref:G-protein coupled receptors family 3 profile domain-containing protein n=1 Tax=Anopheles atroparvus TaxID=41427 RepID=A0A182J2J8_ANOAO